MKVTEINIYPIKSLSGISLNHTHAEVLGLKHDRRMMLVDEKGMFISQRKVNKLALLKCQLYNDVLVVSSGNNQIDIPLDNKNSMSNTEVTVWNDTFQAELFPESINQWFSEELNKKVHLVKYGSSSSRIKKFDKDPRQSLVSFADGYPYLLLGTASMNFLNDKLETSIKIDRFRANIVVETNEAHQEDGWEDFVIGSARFKNIKTCKRCIMTTIDQQTGVKGSEPLKTLSTYRKLDSHIHFGTNLICTNHGKIHVGDSVDSVDF